MIENLYLQRLRLHSGSGFAYDRTMSPEYDSMCVTKSKCLFAEYFAQNKIKAKMVEFIEVIGTRHKDPVEVVLFSTPEMIANLTNDQFVGRAVREAFLTENRKIAGWLNVCIIENDYRPLLIVRTTIPDAQRCVDSFFNPLIKKYRYVKN